MTENGTRLHSRDRDRSFSVVQLSHGAAMDVISSFTMTKGKLSAKHQNMHYFCKSYNIQQIQSGVVITRSYLARFWIQQCSDYRKTKLSLKYQNALQTSTGLCNKDVYPLLTQLSYVFLALTSRLMLMDELCVSTVSTLKNIGRAIVSSLWTTHGTYPSQI